MRRHTWRGASLALAVASTAALAACGSSSKSLEHDSLERGEHTGGDDSGNAGGGDERSGRG